MLAGGDTKPARLSRTGFHGGQDAQLGGHGSLDISSDKSKGRGIPRQSHVTIVRPTLLCTGAGSVARIFVADALLWVAVIPGCECEGRNFN